MDGTSESASNAQYGVCVYRREWCCCLQCIYVYIYLQQHFKRYHWDKILHKATFEVNIYSNKRDEGPSMRRWKWKTIKKNIVMLNYMAKAREPIKCRMASKRMMLQRAGSGIHRDGPLSQLYWAPPLVVLLYSIYPFNYYQWDLLYYLHTHILPNNLKPIKPNQTKTVTCLNQIPKSSIFQNYALIYIISRLL